MKIEGKNKWESLSYKAMIISAVLIFFGILLGSFIQNTIYLASFGSLLLMLGICLYIASQLIEKTDKEGE